MPAFTQHLLGWALSWSWAYKVHSTALGAQIGVGKKRDKQMGTDQCEHPWERKWGILWSTELGTQLGMGAQKRPPEDAQRSHEGPVDSTGQAGTGVETTRQKKPQVR